MLVRLGPFLAISLSFFSHAGAACAQAQPYVRTWDQAELQRIETCTRLLGYWKAAASDESRCTTLRQMRAQSCFGIKGYPDLRDSGIKCGGANT